MATFRANWAGTANTTLPNLLTGSKWETLRRVSAIKVYGCMDTATGTVQATLSVGNVVIAEDLILPNRAVGFGPLRNEDLLTKGVGRPHDLLQLKLQEVGGVNTPTRVLVDIDDVM